MNQPICLFDSGIGGLTVLKKLLEKFPSENYIYLADLANVPYGDKSKTEIENIATANIEWLSRFNPKLIIMACNTSSAILSSQLSALSSQLNIMIFEMIENCVKGIAKKNYKKVTIWATKLVADNNAYKNAIQKINPEINVEEIGCPKLVPMIEGLSFTISDRKEIINEYLNKTSKDSEALILGCTHYPLIQEDIKQLTNLEIIDPGDALVSQLSAPGSVSLYATAQPEKLKRFSKFYLCGDFEVSLVSLKKILV